MSILDKMRIWGTRKSRNVEIIPRRSVEICPVKDGINYIVWRSDKEIARFMKDSGCSYASEQIDLFLKWVNKYYSVENTGGGYFLDIGANIGTTSVYVAKKIDSDINIIAFEPSKENARILKCNCILNECDVLVEEMGLSNTVGEMTLSFLEHNPGGSYMTDLYQGIPVWDVSAGEENTSTVKLASLDRYLLEKSILPREIRYIWLDVEGYESRVIEGAMGTLKACKIPLFTEFNPFKYEKHNELEKFIENLSTIYSFFIDQSDYVEEEKVIPIEKLKDLVKEMREKGVGQKNLFFL